MPAFRDRRERTCAGSLCFYFDSQFCLCAARTVALSHSSVAVWAQKCGCFASCAMNAWRMRRAHSPVSLISELLVMYMDSHLRLESSTRAGVVYGNVCDEVLRCLKVIVADQCYFK